MTSGRNLSDVGDSFLVFGVDRKDREGGNEDEVISNPALRSFEVGGFGCSPRRLQIDLSGRCVPWRDVLATGRRFSEIKLHSEIQKRVPSAGVYYTRRGGFRGGTAHSFENLDEGTPADC